MYGTENIQDLLNICYGDDYINTIKWDNSKYQVIEKYFHPINFKIMPWKQETTRDTSKSIEKNKIIEDFVIVEKADNLECFRFIENQSNIPIKSIWY